MCDTDRFRSTRRSGFLPFICAVALSAAAGVGGPAEASTITVDSVSDAVAADGVCTLREAISSANGVAVADCAAGEPPPVRDVIEFDIPGAGVKTIEPLTWLPSLTEPVFIDGYSQPGASPNTLTVGTDATLLIELNLERVLLNSRGIRIASDDCEVRGLVINRAVLGITVDAGFGDGVVLAGNYLGTDATGTIAVTTVLGVVLEGAGVRVGGTAPADRNVLAGNLAAGVRIFGADNTVVGNYIGTDSSGLVALPNRDGVEVRGDDAAIGVPGRGNVISGNTEAGVRIQGGSGTTVHANRIGIRASGAGVLPNGVGVDISSDVEPTLGVQVGSPGSGNWIAFNLGDGIAVNGAGSPPVRGHTFSANSIHDNGNLGINLVGLAGVEPNDPLDLDDGPNGLQNYPELLSAQGSGGNLEIEWLLDSAPSSAYRLEFFQSASCDASGHGEGETFVGEANAVTDPAGTVQGFSSFPAPSGSGVLIATATDQATGETSEFSSCIPLPIIAEIPTLSQWGAFLFALLIAVAAAYRIGRLRIFSAASRFD